jgi:hypothetical protein
MGEPFTTHRRKDAFNMGKSERQPLGKPRHRWKNDIKVL